MKLRVRDLRESGDKLYSQRQPFMSLCQNIAENFYPERADFTRQMIGGEDFASNLMTSSPVIIRRDLANLFSSMLRPRDRKWFHARTASERINEDPKARLWLDRQASFMWRVMYARKAGFIKATKQGDNDFATFGQCVISVDVPKHRAGLLYRARHLRDCAWTENDEQEIDVFHCNWNPQARELAARYPEKVHQSVKTAADKEPFKEIKCRHIIVPTDMYDLTTQKKNGEKKHPFVCIYVDIENDVVLEETPLPLFNQVIPRWITVTGSQYAYSPATWAALPDARLLQQITLTLLEAGQKAVDPPLMGVSEVIQGAINSYPGGVTWRDADYDEGKSGEALRQVYDSKPNLGWGVDREQRIEANIIKAFYLDQISLPPVMAGEKMREVEVQARLSEYVRRALPLFEPMEVEYNGALCDISFETLMGLKAFEIQDMPEILRGKNVQWQFDSPLQAASERKNAQAYVQAAQLLKVAAEIDPSSRHRFKNDTAFSDALRGADVPAEWVADDDEFAAGKKSDQQAAQAQATAAAVGTAGAVAEQAGKGIGAMRSALMPVPQGELPAPGSV